MGQQFKKITDFHRSFIKEQQVFFVATAAKDGRVNVSPKGMDAFRVLSDNRVAWLNVTGSGNETAAHVQLVNRMTIMFMAVQGNPLILRLYGSARIIQPQDAQWDELSGLFPDFPGSRQIFDCTIDLVQNSCGMAVPLYEFQGHRDNLNQWATGQGPDGIEAYWQKKNTASIDGFPTDIKAE